MHFCIDMRINIGYNDFNDKAEALMSRKKVTIKDIANYVGVTPMTVSYVINQTPNQSISAETKQRVLDAVKKLNYVPNNAAKALRLNQTYCIGVAMEKKLIVQRYAQILEGIRSRLEENGYSILLCNNQQSTKALPEYMNCFLENRVDGIIYVSMDGQDIPEKYQKQIKQFNIPFVALDCEDMENFSTVQYDYYRGACQQTEHLIKKGAKHLIYFRPQTNTKQERYRLRGVEDTLKKYPEVTLAIYEIPYSVEKEQEVPNLGMIYDKTMLGIFSKALEDEQDNIQEKDGIICSWGRWVEVVFAETLKRGMKVQISGLAEGTLYAPLWDNVTYSSLPNYEAGCILSEMILEQIKKPEIVRHEVLSPL